MKLVPFALKNKGKVVSYVLTLGPASLAIYSEAVVTSVASLVSKGSINGREPETKEVPAHDPRRARKAHR
jgi:hypothetical protein